MALTFIVKNNNGRWFAFNRQFNATVDRSFNNKKEAKDYVKLLNKHLKDLNS